MPLPDLQSCTIEEPPNIRKAARGNCQLVHHGANPVTIAVVAIEGMSSPIVWLAVAVALARSNVGQGMTMIP